MRGTVFNIQRFSLFDGPGVRTAVFLKGCPLRCLWCHNPEGLKEKPQIMFDPARCIGCGVCTRICSRHVNEGGSHRFLRELCEGCGKCAEECYSGALTLTGKLMSVDEVMDAVLRDMPFYAESGGGMTLSGGEPLLQADFSLELLRRAKGEGIHTAVETSGFGDSAKLAKLAEYTDIFLFDYKATGDELHRRLCGVPQAPILKNLALLDSMGKETVLRCPIIPSLNDTDEHIGGIARTALSYKCIKEVQLEPYHRLGISKSALLGIDAAYDGEAPDKDVMVRYCEKIKTLSGKPASVS